MLEIGTNWRYLITLIFLLIFEYGNNINYAGFAEDLMLDVYEPNGDTLANGDSVTDRPLVLLAHGGSFIGGSKTGSDVVPLAESFAKMGYVVASINYRLGFQTHLLLIQ